MMKFLTALDKFEQILSKYGAIKRIDQLRTSFEEVEAVINFKLPDDYKVFASKYSEFEDSIRNEYVMVWDFDKIVEMNTGYLIFDNLPQTLAIGGNGGGEYIAIEQIACGNLRIVLSPFIIEKDAHIEIGSSFTNFLERLEKGKGWFS